MPEMGEVFIMSEFLKKELRHRDVLKIEKNELSKNKCDLSILDNKIWKFDCSSRGKEMMVTLISDETHYMKIGFARIGYVKTFDFTEIQSEEFIRNAMLRFYTKDKIFAICDFTRYVIWRWSDEWDKNRSPDVLLEHNKWIEHIYDHRKIPYFNRPVFELMCDQRFFNGIGTFSRTEILARVKFSPFTPFSDILKNEELRSDFFITCKETLNDIINFGGLQFKYWKNPFGVSKEKMDGWIRCYNKLKINALYLRDSSGRKLWFHREWIIEYTKWVKSNEVQDTRLLEKIYRKTKK